MNIEQLELASKAARAVLLGLQDELEKLPAALQKAIELQNTKLVLTLQNRVQELESEILTAQQNYLSAQSRLIDALSGSDSQPDKT